MLFPDNRTLQANLLQPKDSDSRNMQSSVQRFDAVFLFTPMVCARRSSAGLSNLALPVATLYFSQSGC